MKWMGLLASVVVLAAWSAALAGPVPVPAGLPEIVARTESLPMVLGYADVDKAHGGTGGWGTNYYDDLNSNGSHDPGEPFGDSVAPTWGNPKSAADNSCWLASACDMLEQLGKVPSGAALYSTYALNGVPSPSGVLTWDDGGLQEYAIQHWMNQNPVQAAGMTMVVHWPNANWMWTDWMHAWDWSPRTGVANYLAAGWEVGIGMWPLMTDGAGNFWHDFGHALTMQAINLGATFDCTDSDRDGDWSAPGDLNTYTDATRGPIMAPDGTVLHGWYNDFYDGDITVYPVGDFGYVCAIVPEPGSLALIGLGAVALLRRRRR